MVGNFFYSTDNAFAATLSEDDSDGDLTGTAVKKILPSEDNQQELTGIRNMLLQISSDNYQH